ncbi:MAG TPA: DinB family protein [Jatrophihabitans sp.]|nr:DinB family protein [Jatrophihabitans sp.]
MTVPMDADDRPEPPLLGDERATLIGFLDYQRATLEWKCSGLDPEQLARRAMPPSTMSLLGLVRHLAEVEWSWFDRFGMDGYRRDPYFFSMEDLDRDFDGAQADPALVTEAFEKWHSAIEEARAVVAGHELDAGFMHRRWEREVSLRWVLTHMIEEYARHNGHADLLREAIDGAKGE